MTSRIAWLAAVCTVMALSGAALARPAVTEHRIKTIEFTNNAVVALEGCPNFQTTVVFGPGERIENVGLGDAGQWQVMPNKRADLLFVKPLVETAFSNMTVVTGQHIYNFELRSASPAACRRGRVVYTLRFHYADAPVAAKPAESDPEAMLPPAEKRNSAYTFSGDQGLVPFRIFDDGKSTYFLWSKGVATPAIYASGNGDQESLVNYANRGDYVVVETVARSFVLKRGEQTATLFNDAFVVPKLDALSPQPAKKEERGFWPF